VANPTTIKTNNTFKEFISKVREEGFNPSSRQHVSEFNLKHADKFQTLTQSESSI
jgi:hypothetical protein